MRAHLPVSIQGYEVYKHYDRIMMKRVMSIFASMPLKIRTMHWCAGSPSSALFLVLPELKFMLGKHLRQHLIIHSLSTPQLVAEFTKKGIDARGDVLLRGNYENDELLQRFWEEIKEREQYERDSDLD